MRPGLSFSDEHKLLARELRVTVWDAPEMRRFFSSLARCLSVPLPEELAGTERIMREKPTLPFCPLARPSRHRPIPRTV
ncbi:MAG: hypothetical protein N3A57_03590 [Negativicutes bacterium]|nr:hypothetical protein [Negativicutes bacterium]